MDNKKSILFIDYSNSERDTKILNAWKNRIGWGEQRTRIMDFIEKDLRKLLKDQKEEFTDLNSILKKDE